MTTDTITEAQELLFNNNLDIINKVVRKYFFTTNPLYEDAVSIARISLWKACVNHDASRTNDQFRGYAYIKVKYSVIDYLWYTLRRTKPLVSIDNEDNSFDIVDESATHTADKLNSDFMTKVYSEIKKLNHKEQKILQMYYLEGKTGPEIAEKYNVTKMRISQIINKSLKTLRFRMRAV